MEYAVDIQRLLCDFLKSWKEVSYWSYVQHMPPHEQRRFKKYSTLETWCRRISSRKEKWKRKENKSHPFLDFLQSTYFAAQLESLNTSLCPITSQFSENIVGMSFCDCRLSKPFIIYCLNCSAYKKILSMNSSKDLYGVFDTVISHYWFYPTKHFYPKNSSPDTIYFKSLVLKVVQS